MSLRKALEPKMTVLFQNAIKAEMSTDKNQNDQDIE